MAHFHFSNHEQCRIPLKGTVAFSDFVKFIVFHFYGKKIEIAKANYTNQYISREEQEMIHFFWK